MSTYPIPLPWQRPPLSGNDRGHTRYRSHAVAKALEEARWAVRAANLPELGFVQITLCWQPTTHHRRDPDNLAPTYKVCSDALVQEGVIADDSSAQVKQAAQRITPPGTEARMWLEVLALSPCDYCAVLVPEDELSDGRECSASHCRDCRCRPCATAAREDHTWN